MAEYVVTAACVVAKTDSETGEGYYYRDAILPAGVPAAEKKRLVEAGLIKVADEEPAATDPEAEAEAAKADAEAKGKADAEAAEAAKAAAAKRPTRGTGA